MVITKNKLQLVIEEIQSQYLNDDMPWVIGYSGGKDSTATLQLVLHALSGLHKENLNKEVHVLSNDTLVENPAVVAYIDEQLTLIEKAGKKNLFPHAPNHFQVAKVVPKIEDRFWINLIGKGYPAPNRWFRWCTKRMKINPTNDYILRQVSKHGKALVVLGSRRSESTNRQQSLDKYDLEAINGQKVRKHTLPNSWMYTPVINFSTDEIWSYLMSVPSFWGGNNKKLRTMYRNASDDANECPLVVDTSTQSCGNSRFGCWVCTVVKRDKSMENLIDNGEDWMYPMLEFRDYLQEIRNDETKRLKESQVNPNQKGAFLFEVRAELLKKVFEIEQEIDQEVISKPELAAIQVQWQYHGCFDYSVADIYFQVKKERLMISDDHAKAREREEIDLLKKSSKKYNVKAEHIQELLVTEQENVTYLKRRNIIDDFQKKIERFVKEV